MSGHKRETVTISQEEYRRMYEAERRSMYETYAAPREPSVEILMQREETYQSIAQSALERKQDYDGIIAGLKSEIKSNETNAQKQLEQQQNLFLHSISAESNRLEHEMSRRLNSQINQVENEYLRNESYYEEQLRQQFQLRENELYTKISSELRQIRDQDAGNHYQVNQRLKAVEGNDHSQRQRNLVLESTARKWIEDTWEIHEFIINHYDSRFVDASALNELGSAINQTKINFQSGFFEASLSACQGIFNQLSRLRLKAETDIVQFAVVFHQVLEHLCDFHAQLDDYSSIPAIDIHGNKLDVMLRVDEWTENSAHNLAIETANLIRKLQDHPHHFNKDDLNGLLNEVIPSFRQQFFDLLDKVQFASLNAQIRFNIAQMVVAALLSQGYGVDQGTFQQNNYCKGYVLKAKSVGGGELTVRIDPIPGETFASDLHIVSQDHQIKTHHEMKQRALEINRSLKQFGLQISSQREIKQQKPSVRASQSHQTKHLVPSD